MPVLLSEPDVYPNNLLQNIESVARPGAQWWALYTLSRREKKVMRSLHHRSIPFYSPLVHRRVRGKGGRPRDCYVPLFAGYVFLLGDHDQREQVLKTNCISRTLPVPDVTDLVRDLHRIWRLIQSDAPLVPEARLEPGTKVRVRNGPLADMEGMVIHRRGRQRLLVAVEFLRQGVSVSLDDFMVERID